MRLVLFASYERVHDGYIFAQESLIKLTRSKYKKWDVRDGLVVSVNIVINENDCVKSPYDRDATSEDVLNEGVLKSICNV